MNFTNCNRGLFISFAAFLLAAFFTLTGVIEGEILFGGALAALAVLIAVTAKKDKKMKKTMMKKAKMGGALAAVMMGSAVFAGCPAQVEDLSGELEAEKNKNKELENTNKDLQDMINNATDATELLKVLDWASMPERKQHVKIGPTTWDENGELLLGANRTDFIKKAIDYFKLHLSDNAEQIKSGTNNELKARTMNSFYVSKLFSSTKIHGV